MKIQELQTYKKILILGMGKEGASAKRFIEKNASHCKIIVADQKDGPDYLNKQNDVDLVVRSPGVRLEFITKPSTTATNLFFGNSQGTIIGVTGTKGKSTTASLITAMLKEHLLDVRLVGNIGNPMLDALVDSTEKTVFVAELSSYQLADIHYSPHIAVVVNWFPEHGDFHGSFDAYKKAKQRILAFQNSNDYFVFDPCEEPSNWAHLTKARIAPYVADFPFEKNKIKLLGSHNIKNIQAGMTVARLFDIPNDVIAKALFAFEPLPHRLERVGTYAQITFYDDAISTTPQSTLAALHTLDNVNTIFLGGQDRGYDFTDLAIMLKEKNIRNIVLFPDTGKRIKSEIEKIDNFKPHIFETDDMQEAVKFAYKETQKGTICLLSTASPSYSVWKNFEEKGELFQQFVYKLSKNNETTANF